MLRPRSTRLAVWFGFALTAPVAGERLPIRVYTIADGLAHDQVNAVYQDRQGFIWFGTGEGLSRFDGQGFASFGVDDGLPPPGSVTDLLETRDGSLWVATDNGLCRFLSAAGARARAQRPLCLAVDLGPSKSGSAPTVRTLFEDGGGRVWVGTTEALLVSETPPSEFSPVRTGAICRGEFVPGVRAIEADGAGGLWLGTSCGLAHLSADGHTRHYPIQLLADDDRVFDVALDGKGNLWISHVSGGVLIWRPPGLDFEPPAGWALDVEARRQRARSPGGGRASLPAQPGDVVQWTTRDGLPGDHARQKILPAQDGTVWIGTSFGLAHFDGETLHSYFTRNGLSDNGAIPALEDSAGNLWFGSLAGGAMRLLREGFTTFTEEDGIHGWVVRSIHEGGDGELYLEIGGSVNALHHRDGDRFTAVLPERHWGWGLRQTGFLSREREWWVPGNGVSRYPRDLPFEDLPRTRARLYAPADGLGGWDVYTLYQDSRGDVWAGTWGPGYLSRWQRASDRFATFGSENSVPQAPATAFAEDGHGRLWIGFSDGTLLSFALGAEDVRFDRHSLGDPPASGISSLFFDRNRDLWVGTQDAGAYRVTAPGSATPSIARWTREQGLPSNQVACFVEDVDGRLYIGTHRGLVRLDPASGELRHYTIADGLANNRLTTAFRDREGEVWFGTLGGLSRLRPRENPRPQARPLVLTAIEIAGQPVPLSERGERHVRGLRIPAGSDRLSLSVAILSFVAGERPRYEYRLGEGGWSPPTAERTLVIANLRAGRHRLSLRGVGGGVENAEPATVDFRVLAPFWRQPWFLALAAALLALIAVALYRARVARLLAVERLRTRIATDLHDDIGASLSRIAILSEVAKLKAADGPRDHLDEIGEEARGLIDSMSDIVWAIQPQSNDFSSLVWRLRKFASGALEPQGVALDFQVPAEPAVPLSAAQRQHLFALLKEAIANSARHARARRVLVRLSLAPGRLLAEVADDGRGLADAAKGGVDEELRGNGLRNMRRRAAALGGELRIETQSGSGTRVRLEVPLGRAGEVA